MVWVARPKPFPRSAGVLVTLKLFCNMVWVARPKLIHFAVWIVRFRIWSGTRIGSHDPIPLPHCRGVILVTHKQSAHEVWVGRPKPYPSERMVAATPRLLTQNQSGHQVWVARPKPVLIARGICVTLSLAYHKVWVGRPKPFPTVWWGGPITLMTYNSS